MGIARIHYCDQELANMEASTDNAKKSLIAKKRKLFQK